jgi:DNA-3-methyladenine glycosylase II
MNSVTNTKALHKKYFVKDQVLLKLVDTISPPTWKSTENVFHDIMSCIIEQQIHYRSSKNTFQHVMQEAGLDELSLENFHLVEPVLSTLRLSESKFKAMADTIHFFSQNNICWYDLSDEEIRISLKSIRGIGRWTTDMILLYTLHRPDIFPYDDYHLHQIMPKLYGLDPKNKLTEKMKAIAEHWKGNRSLGVLYLLAWKNQSVKKTLY